MTSDYQPLDNLSTMILTPTSGVASRPSLLSKDSSMDFANSSSVRNLFNSNSFSPYYNPGIISDYPISTKTIPYNNYDIVTNVPTLVEDKSLPSVTLYTQEQVDEMIRNALKSKECKDNGLNLHTCEDNNYLLLDKKVVIVTAILVIFFYMLKK